MVAMAAPARKKNKKRGFLQSSTFYLILLFLAFVMLVTLTGRIFAGAGIGEKLCAAVPWFCGSEQQADYYSSERSTNALVCAAGFAATDAFWPGGPNLNCDEFYDKSTKTTTGGDAKTSSGTPAAGGITGAATAEEEKNKELRISEVRNLKPSFSCAKDNAGKMSCTVKNFLMPQEVAKLERIPYFGDPDYLIYWGSFPHEEDTWNFKIEWWYHGIIFLASILPFEKVFPIGFKAAWTALRGPSKSLLAKETAKIVFENVGKATLREFEGQVVLRAGLTEAEQTAFKKILAKTTTKLVEGEAEVLAKGLSKLPKKTLKKIATEVGVKESNSYFAKKLATTGLIDALEKRLASLKSVKTDLKILGKFAIGEIGLRALASSSMKKYEPIGNAIAIKNPGNETNDLKTFSLPDEMKGKPVLVRWRPSAKLLEGQTEIKQLHFASPCYLSEFYLTHEDDIVCGEYLYDRTGNQLLCEKAKISKEAPLECNVFSSSIDRLVDYKIYDKINNEYLKVKDKALFEFDDDWHTTKINLAWFLNGDKSGPKYQLGDIGFDSQGYECYRGVGGGGPGEGTPQTSTCYTEDVFIGKGYEESGSFYETADRKYKTRLSEGSKDLALVEFESGDKTVMNKGKDYVLHIYHVTDKTLLVAADDVAVDIYDLETCDRIMDLPREKEYEKKELSCEELRQITTEKKMSDIKSIINDVQENKGKETKIRVKPDSDVKAQSSYFPDWGIGNCGGGLSKQICFSILYKIEVYISCKGGSSFFPQTIYEERCEIDLPRLAKNLDDKIFFKRSIELELREEADEQGNKRFVKDIVYSTQSYKLNNKLTVSFQDFDEDEKWDTLILENDKPEFKIALSDVQNKDTVTHITMSNCKTDGLLVTFKDNALQNSKINVEGVNYCMRQKSGITKFLEVGGDIVVAVGIIATGVISGGSSTAIFVATVIGAGVTTGIGIEAEREQIWPYSAGG